MIFDLALLYLTRKTSCLRLLPSECAARCQPIPDSELHIQLREFSSPPLEHESWSKADPDAEQTPDRRIK
jgi:hypothetical protein